MKSKINKKTTPTRPFGPRAKVRPTSYNRVRSSSVMAVRDFCAACAIAPKKTRPFSTDAITMSVTFFLVGLRFDYARYRTTA
jgi:hypothetical protein